MGRAGARPWEKLEDTTVGQQRFTPVIPQGPVPGINETPSYV